MTFSNELIFILYSSLISSAVLIALRIGKEALITFLGLMAVLANLLVSKQIFLFGFNATASDALAIGATLNLNILQEFYGRPSAQRAIWISFAGLLFYTLISQLHLWYLPSHFDACHQAYYLILHNMPHIACASLIVYFIVQQLDYRLYSFLKKHYEGKYFLLRNLISLSCTQLIDTILFTLLGLYGVVSHLTQIIVVSYTIKLLTIILSIPFLVFARKFYKP